KRACSVVRSLMVGPRGWQTPTCIISDVPAGVSGHANRCRPGRRRVQRGHVTHAHTAGRRPGAAVIRPRSLPALAVGSLVALAVLVYLLSLEARPSGRAVKVYCAAALKPVMQSIAAEFEAETGQRVAFDFGDSGSMLGNAALRRDGDL